MLGPDAEVEVENFQAHDGDLIEFFVCGELVKTVRLPSRACTAPAAPMMAGWPPQMLASSSGTPVAAGAGKGIRSLWRRATGRESTAAHLGSGRPVYAGF